MYKIKILVANHKSSFLFKNDIIEPIHVGKAISKEDIPIIGDDTGENISKLNPFYCETTAIFWAWKNLKNIDFIGLFHYRRYLLEKKKENDILSGIKFNINKLIGVFNKNYKRGAYPNQIRITSKQNFVYELKITTEYIKRLINIESYKLLIPHRFFYANKTNRDHFGNIGLQHIDILEEIISERDGNFSVIFEKTLNDQYLYPANIFIMDFNYYNEYCTLLFDLLKEHSVRYFKLEGSNKISYSRISGYLAELITNAYIQKLIAQGVKYKELSHAFLTFD